MKVGLFHQMWAPKGAADPVVFAQAIADIRLADELGFDSAWIGEHHFVNDRSFHGRLPSPELLIARLIGETSQIELGTGIKILTIESPLRFAETMSFLDLLTEGRAFFGVGQGGPPYLEANGIADGEKRSRFASHLREVLAYLEPDPSSDRPQISPVPPPHLKQRLWIASRDTDSVKLAAELGLNLIVGQAETAPKQQRYLQTFRQAGAVGQTCGCRLVFVAETTAEAYRAVEAAAQVYFDLYQSGPYYQEGVAEGLIPPTPPTDLADLLARVDYIVGDPETVTRQLNTYVEKLGIDRLNVFMHVAHVPSGSIRRSMALFMQEVAPRLAPVRQTRIPVLNRAMPMISSTMPI